MNLFFTCLAVLKTNEEKHIGAVVSEKDNLLVMVWIEMNELRNL